MNFPKILIGLIVLAILISTAWAQEKKPEFIWSNLEQKYQSFENLKPVIELRNVEFVIFETHPRSNLLMRFDEKEEKWIAGFDILDDNIGQHSNLVLTKNEPMKSFFFWPQFFSYDKCCTRTFFISQDNKKYPIRGKYKIRFYYGNGTELNKFDSYTDSPEFVLEADSLIDSI
jgi:hypothetical protein